MADLDPTHQSMLPAFGWQQWSSNPAGIGNECTHWIYAALLEARALDFDRALHIQQSSDPFTWGRRIQPSEMIPGDILQFYNFQNRFDFYFSVPSGNRWLWRNAIRGPRHTAMCAIAQSHTFDGQHLVLESHLHEPDRAVMTIRDNRVYNANFSISMTAKQLADARLNGSFPADLDLTGPADDLSYALSKRPVWLSLRDNFESDDPEAAKAFHRIKLKLDADLDDDVAFLFRLHTTGHVRFYRPQASDARLNMDDTAFEAEKQRLIASLIKGGRRGEVATPGHPLDQFDSDNKSARRSDGYFNWQFNPAQSP